MEFVWKNVAKTTAKAINNGTGRTIKLSGGKIEGEIVTVTPVSVADDYTGSGCKMNVGTIGEEGDYLVDTTKAKNGDVFVTGSTDTKLFQVGTYNSYMYLTADTENNRLLGTNRYPVSFDLNYESSASTYYITAYDQTVFTDLFGNTNPSICPNREGYTFAGWYSDSDYSEQIIDASGSFMADTSLTTTVGNWKSLVSDTVLYAKWTKIGTNPDPDPTPVVYHIISGANSIWNKNGDGTVTITGDGAKEDFISVKVDGKVIDSKNYDVKSGPTIIILKQSFLDTLSTDEHSFEIIWKDGSAKTKLTVNEMKTNPSSDSEKNDIISSKPPKVGDDSPFLLWILVFLGAGTGLIVTASKRCKKETR